MFQILSFIKFKFEIMCFGPCFIVNNFMMILFFFFLSFFGHAVWLLRIQNLYNGYFKNFLLLQLHTQCT